MRKLLIALTAIIGFLFVGTGAGQAESAIRLFMDSKELKPEVPPRIMNDNTMVPVRIISEELGAKVAWDASDKKVTVEKKGLVIQLFIDKTDAYVNGTRSKLETAPALLEGSTLLPVRFISETLGLLVTWDELTRSVSLYHNGDSFGNSEGKPAPTTASAVATAVPKPTATPVATATVTPSPSPAATASQTPTATPAPSSTVRPAATPSSSTGSKPGWTASPAPSASAALQTGGTASGSGLPEVQQIVLEGDVLRIKASGGDLQQPKFSRLSSPDRLVIDLPMTALGKTVNGKPAVQNGEAAATHPSITKIRYSLFKDNPSTVRIVVDLNQKIAYNLLESNNSGELAISLRTAKYTVVLDAGHGGTDTGAISVTGRYEKIFNLSVVLKVAEILKSESQMDVQLTRREDTTVELNDRAPFANNLGADVFVSVHANKFGNPSVNGVETYYTREDSADLAAVLHKNILAATGASDRRVRTADFRVTKYTVMPAILCEIGYLSNAEEEQQLFSEEVQARVAASIAAGIKEYLQIP